MNLLYSLLVGWEDRKGWFGDNAERVVNNMASVGS